MLYFKDWLKKETAGDSWLEPPPQPLTAMLAKYNAPLPGNISQKELPPNKKEQYKMKKKMKQN